MRDPRSPWPDDQAPERAAPADERDEEREEPARSKGVAITVALGTLGFWVALPVLIAVGVYSMLTIYAIVKAVGSAPDEPNAVAIALGIVGLITLFVVAIGVGVSLIGRAADPKRRR